MTQEESFWSRVDIKGPDDCWEWTGNRTSKNYGKLPFHWEGRSASRYSYYLNIDPDFDRSMFVCHHCDNPPCVNPKHLFLDTQKGNMQDMAKKGRSRGQKVTHCPQGHEYTKENTYVRKSTGKRLCLTCKREQDLKNQIKRYYKNHEKSKQYLRERYKRRKKEVNV